FGGVSSSQDVVFMFSIMYERASSAPMMLEVCITQANQEQADGPAGRRLSRCRPSGRHSFSLSHTHTTTHSHTHITHITHTHHTHTTHTHTTHTHTHHTHTHTHTHITHTHTHITHTHTH